MPESTHPECDKMYAVRDQSQAIGEFLEWLTDEKRILLARYRDDLTDFRSCGTCSDVFSRRPREGCPTCQGTGTVEITLNTRLVPESYDVQRILAEFFEIDLDKVEAEKRLMLDVLRAAQT